MSVFLAWIGKVAACVFVELGLSRYACKKALELNLLKMCFQGVYDKIRFHVPVEWAQTLSVGGGRAYTDLVHVIP